MVRLGWLTCRSAGGGEGAGGEERIGRVVRAGLARGGDGVGRRVGGC